VSFNQSSNRSLADILPGVPPVDSPFFDAIAASGYWDDETLTIARALNDKGYAVIDFPDDDIAARADRIKAALKDCYDWDTWRRDGWRLNDGLRIQDAWKFDEDVLSISRNQRILDLLQKLYGRRAFPFQSLNFPVGTQQHYHSDIVHFSSMPERFMCGVWVALEDISEEAGPLIYYPGSHKWPIFTNDQVTGKPPEGDEIVTQGAYEPVWQELVRLHSAEPETFLAKKGQAVLWAANLLHGGSRQNSPDATRWSQVTHYYFDGCSYFTPVRSHPMKRRFAFRKPIDIATGEEAPRAYPESGERKGSRFPIGRILKRLFR